MHTQSHTQTHTHTNTHTHTRTLYSTQPARKASTCSSSSSSRKRGGLTQAQGCKSSFRGGGCCFLLNCLFYLGVLVSTCTVNGIAINWLCYHTALLDAHVLCVRWFALLWLHCLFFAYTMLGQYFACAWRFLKGQWQPFTLLLLHWSAGHV